MNLENVTGADRVGPRISLVAPAFDEVENLRLLVDAVRGALADLPSWELVVVDDGSTDGTREELKAIAREEPRVRAAHHETNQGQTAALATGIRLARAPLIGTLDADLQNDPRDFLRLLREIEHADAVVGYRERRNDDWVRRLSSRIANRVRDFVTGDSVRDTGCSLKLFRAEAIRAVPLFEGMHRFLPTLVRWSGYHVVEVPVSHAPRRHGRSKYGIANRLWPALKDLLAVRWMRSRMIRREDHRGALVAHLP